MRSTPKKVYLALAASLCLCSLSSLSFHTLRARDNFVISYRLGAETVTLHEPVYLYFELRNNAPGTLTMDLGSDRKGSFEVSFTGPSGTQGKLLRLTKNGLSAPRRISVNPGGTFNETLLLNEWIDFANPGNYQIEVRLSSNTSAPSGANVGNFQGQVEILQANPRRLKKVCESLTQQVETAPGVEEAEDPASALSFITDPIAVPYLERVLHAPGPGALVGDFAVRGLAKIGNDEAIQALVSALDMTDVPTTSIPAWTSLAQLLNQSDDPASRAIIQDALNRYEFKDGRIYKKNGRR
jgi:hypothetical protein